MKRSTLILSVLLVLSAAGNLAVIGIFAGHWLREGGRGGNPPGGGVERLMALVPPPLRPEIDQVMRPRHEDMKAHLDAIREARRTVNETLRQRPFDPGKAEAALAEFRRSTSQVQERLHRTIVDRMAAAQEAGTLPPPPERPTKGKGDDRPEKDGPPPPQGH
ncbi:hypothetical protein CHU95_13095 [Niveispirillum lacus]|uniref:Periplasmic heavy metal sensor n=1 Tax=Niveispirillum lacus TaxID=1981099 RepID=A0A255YW05_9PROT|nr:periplasmic heavy metal sensor [Niveispirillum lacus]OYQ33361.1 hypothetical protein CHU95_13095 [Niveispirillum lacus]